MYCNGEGKEEGIKRPVLNRGEEVLWSITKNKGSDKLIEMRVRDNKKTYGKYQFPFIPIRSIEIVEKQ
jgi:hypothetical protein